MQTGGPVTHVVKRGNRHPEVFDPRKLHKSIVATCLSADTVPGHAESIARRVVETVVNWLAKRPEVTSADLRRVSARALKTYHPDASYIYEHHISIV